MSRQEQDFLATKLKAEMDRLDLTTSDLARALQVSERQITRWRSGKHEPQIGSVRQMARFFGRGIDWFYEAEEVAA